MCAAVEFRILGGIAAFAIPQPTEWQRIGNQVCPAFVFAGVNFVKALEVLTDAGRTACYNALRLDGRFAKSLRETHGLLAWKS